MFKTLTLAAATVLGLAVAGSTAANAATLTYASGFENFAQGLTGVGGAVQASRSDPTTAFDEADGNFVSLGFGGSIVLTFGTKFGSPGAIIEITNVARSTYVESARIFGITALGDEFVLADITNENATTQIFFEGIYTKMRILDTTTDLGVNDRVARDGFDIDAVGVSAVPLPAGGLLLVGALGGLAALRRRKLA